LVSFSNAYYYRSVFLESCRINYYCKPESKKIDMCDACTSKYIQLRVFTFTYFNFLCGFNLKDNKKNLELKNYWDWIQSACELKGIDYSTGMDMLNVKMMQTGSSDV